MTIRKMAVFHYPKASCERARWFACVARPGSHNTEECVGIYETSVDDWKQAQASEIRQAKAEFGILSRAAKEESES